MEGVAFTGVSGGSFPISKARTTEVAIFFCLSSITVRPSVSERFNCGDPRGLLGGGEAASWLLSSSSSLSSSELLPSLCSAMMSEGRSGVRDPFRPPSGSAASCCCFFFDSFSAIFTTFKKDVDRAMPNCSNTSCSSSRSSSSLITDDVRDLDTVENAEDLSCCAAITDGASGCGLLAEPTSLSPSPCSSDIRVNLALCRCRCTTLLRRRTLEASLVSIWLSAGVIALSSVAMNAALVKMNCGRLVSTTTPKSLRQTM
mmetsp:Transcript_9922/g.13579  ORF Transcript_9922/g.13579 Transcript_9922/m.13579 type:complete len:258 (-) Transcript_9922:1697-2470(-)